MVTIRPIDYRIHLLYISVARRNTYSINELMFQLHHLIAAFSFDFRIHRVVRVSEALSNLRRKS